MQEGMTSTFVGMCTRISVNTAVCIWDCPRGRQDGRQDGRSSVF